MTPKRSGRWQRLVGVDRIEEADLAVIIDYTIFELPKHIKKVYMGAHPYGHTVGYRCFDEYKGDPNTLGIHDLRDDAGFGEWWLEEDYDTLSALEPPKKTKKLISIISEKTASEGHIARRRYMEKFCKQYPNDIEIWGRIQPFPEEPNIKRCYKGILGYTRQDPNFAEYHYMGKTQILKDTRYILEHDDNFGCVHYFSERFFDDLLLWCFPIYHGGGQIDRYLPKNSFRTFDYNTDPKEIIEMANSDFREKHIEDMREARHLLLNKYQMWARVWEDVKGKM